MIKDKIKFCLPWSYCNEKIYRLYLKSSKHIKNGNKLFACYYKNKIYNKYKCFISPYSNIKGVVDFPHPIGVVIGDGVTIGTNVIIYQNVTIGRKNVEKKYYPKIGSNVIICAGACILGDVKIGDNSIIGANAVVLEDVPDNSIAVGIPARIIKKK